MLKGGNSVSTELDSLEIRIQSDSQTAAAGIDKLEASLSRLKGTAKGGAGLTSTVNQINKLSSALGSLQNLNGLSALAKALEPLQSVSKASGLISTVNALKKIPDITRQLSSSELRKFGLQMQLVAKYMAPLATEMQKVANGFAAFPARIQRVIQGNSSLAASNKKTASSFTLLGSPITTAIAKLTAYGYVTRQVVGFLADCVMSVNSYVENINLFQVSMGEFYDEAFAYAQLVNEKLGIDPSEWMRTQGVCQSIATGVGVAEDQAYALSEGLTELAYDISSLYNEDMESSAQRLQSALAGEIEPIRRLGIAISEASLSEFALSKGIDKSIESMTEQEKALLRTLKIMESAGEIGAIGDFAKTLESPANALRVLNQQITQLKRSIGSVLLPILVQVIPYIQAFVELLTEAISALAALVGFELPTWDANDWGAGISTGASDAAGAVSDATDAVKELKNATMGIDELNIISPPEASGAGAGGLGADWAAGLEIPDIWDKKALEEMQSQVDVLKEKLRPVFNLALAIGAAFLAWKIGSSIFSGLNSLKTLMGTIFGSKLFKSFTAQLASTLGAMILQFNIAGGGVSGFLSVLKMLAAGAAPVVAVILLIASTLKVLVQRWDDIKAAMESIFEKLGIQQKLQALQQKLDELGQKLGWVDGFWQGLKATISSLLDLIGGVVITVLGSLLTGAFNGLVEVVSGLITAVSGVLDIFSGLADFLVGVFTLDLEKVKSGVEQMGSGIKQVFSGLWQAVVGGVTEFVNGVLTAISELGGTLLNEKIPEIIQGIKDWFMNVWNFFKETLPRWWNETIAPWFTLERWAQLGKMALDGLISGLSKIGESIWNWGEDVINKVKEVLGIHSPSTVFEGLGVYAIEGLRMGMSGITFMSALFNEQISAMKLSATTFFTDMKLMFDTAMAELNEAIAVMMEQNKANTETIAANYQEMASKSNSAIRSIISSLNSIPRNIRTVHTIVTRRVSGGSSGDDVDGYASGGFPTPGQLFLAREAGPELVGSIGGRTAVANNDQIVQGIAQGVYDAMIKAAEATAGNGQPIIVELNGDKVGRSVTNWQQKQGASITKGAFAYAY